MKMKTGTHYMIMPMILLFNLFNVSCRKDKNTGNPADAEMVAAASADDQLMESTFNGVFDDATGIDDATAGDELGIYGNAGAGVFARTLNHSEARVATRCFTVSVTPKVRGVFPKTVTLDFGDGCRNFGHIRKGKIIFTYSGGLHVPGNRVVTTFDGYSIDSFAIQGKHTLINSASAGANQKKFTTIVENARVTNTLSGKWWTWNSERVFTQTEGNGTGFFPFDDVFTVKGGSNGSGSAERNWESEITHPLTKKMTCRWLVEGTVKIRVNNTVGSLDLGNGTCDNKANLTVNGVFKVLTLR